MKTHYQILNVSADAPKELIAESAKTLLLLLQPRQNASEAAQQDYLDVARAYKVLSDPLLRAAYDADLHSQPANNISSTPAPQPEPVTRSAQSKSTYAAQGNDEHNERMAGYGIDPESLSRVKKGEASLAKAFWYYTVLLPVAWFIVSLTVFSIFSPSQNFFNNITGSSMLAICGYSLFYSMPAIWRSSRHSSVSPFWRRTTKAVTILLLVCFILTAFLLGVYASAQRSVSKNSSFTSGDVAQENRIDLASAVLDKNQSSTKEYPVKTTAPWDEFKPKADPADLSIEEYLATLDTEPAVVVPPPALDPAEEHYKKIRQAHPDADSIYNSGEFKNWIERYPLHIKTLDGGSTQEVIALFSAYKDYSSRNIPSAYSEPSSVQDQPQPLSSQSCIYKGVMTQADYDACGITPP